MSSDTSLDEQIASTIQSYLPQATEIVPGIMRIDSSTCCISSTGQVGVNRQTSDIHVLSILDIIKHTVSSTQVVLSISTKSHIRTNISHVVISIPELDIHDTVIQHDTSIRTNSTQLTVTRYNGTFKLSFTELCTQVSDITISAHCVDTVGNVSSIYTKTASIKTSFIPTWLTPSNVVHGTTVPMVIDTLHKNISEIEWVVTIDNQSKTYNTSTNSCVADVTDILPTTYTDTTSVYKTAGTENMIAAVVLTIDDEPVLLGVTHAGRLCMMVHDVVSQLSYACVDNDTRILDMIVSTTHTDVCYLLTVTSGEVVDTYSVYSTQGISGILTHVRDIDYIDHQYPIKFNHHRVTIDDHVLIGISYTDGIVKWVDTSWSDVRIDKFIQHRDIRTADDIVVSIAMLHDKLFVWCRYRYEVYTLDGDELVLIHSSDNLSKPWLSLGAKDVSFVVSEDMVIYSTKYGIYSSSDGINWSRICDTSQVFTPNSTTTYPTVLHYSNIDGIQQYIGCIIEEDRVTSMCVTSDLTNVTHIPMIEHMVYPQLVTTMTGKDIIVPGYRIVHRQVVRDMVLTVRCRIDDVWTDTSTLQLQICA